jgi:hypothetical protein
MMQISPVLYDFVAAGESDKSRYFYLHAGAPRHPGNFKVCFGPTF